MVFNAAVNNIVGPSWPWSSGSWIDNYLFNRCLSPLMLWVRLPPRARCTTLRDTNWQWLAVGRWISPVSSTNKTDRHDIAEILLKVALSTIKPTNQQYFSYTVAVSFIGGGNRSSRGKPPNCHKALTNVIT
jgi:hypothetical protein